jgi:hypothetical protein
LVKRVRQRGARWGIAADDASWCAGWVYCAPVGRPAGGSPRPENSFSTPHGLSHGLADARGPSPGTPLLLIILPAEEVPADLFNKCEGDRFDSSAANARIRPIG